MMFSEVRFLVAAAFTLSFAAVSVGAEPARNLAQSGPTTLSDHHDTRPTASAMDEIGLTGSVGTYRVGAHLTVHDHRTIIAGHYFYASRLIDIPLVPATSGETIVLREPGGGVFRLQLKSANRSARLPLDFATATALAGTWTNGRRVLPVRLGFDMVGGPQGAGRYSSVMTSTAAAFETRVRTFLQGAIAEDRQKVVSAISFPLTVNATKPVVIGNREQLFAHWREIFSPCMVAELRTAVPHEMFVRDGLAMIGNGVAWFDAHGATRLNPPKCAKPTIPR